MSTPVDGLKQSLARDGWKFSSTMNDHGETKREAMLTMVTVSPLDAKIPQAATKTQIGVG